MNRDRLCAEAGFELDPRLAADTVVLADWPLCRVCLMDDTRFGWLILVPRRAGLDEIDQLDAPDQLQLWSELRQAMALLREHFTVEKLNIGALGNIVRQLHVHVVARHTGDAAWPGPVWGAGEPRRHAPEALAMLCNRLTNACARLAWPLSREQDI